MEREVDGRIGAASAVLRALHRPVVVKKELSQKAKLSIYWSIYVPPLTYGHELWCCGLNRTSHRNIYAENKSFIFVFLEECSDASEADLQSRRWSHVPSDLQARR